MQTVYYCVQSATSIYKTFLEYKKVQEISKLNRELDKQQHITQSLIEYCNIIRNDINQLMHLYFKSACENLQFAMNSQDNNRNDYLIQARSCFINALSVEKNENLILSYIGLSLCQSFLNDEHNAQVSLSRIRDVLFNHDVIDRNSLQNRQIYDIEGVAYFSMSTMILYDLHKKDYPILMKEIDDFIDQIHNYKDISEMDYHCRHLYDKYSCFRTIPINAFREVTKEGLRLYIKSTYEQKPLLSDIKALTEAHVTAYTIVREQQFDAFKSSVLHELNK